MRQADVVVIGSGVGGMRAALALSPLRVLLVTKAALGEGGSSPYAQGGIAAAIDSGDSPANHRRDTVRAGGGLNFEPAVEVMTQGAPLAIEELEAFGARFDRDEGGSIALGREGGHSRRRILHAGGDATGRELIRSLSAALVRSPGIEIWDRVFARDLVVDDGQVVGVDVDVDAERSSRILAPAVLLATGGCGQLYRYTTNPSEVTGDGMAMAARAGASLVDLEFVQFHPTALATDRDPLPLLTEALRGEGVPVVDERGVRFLTAVHPDAELAPRDVVARAIFTHRQAGHEVFLDTRHVADLELESRFPTVVESCRRAGLDPYREPLPVTPAAHYFMGGVEIDGFGRTSLAGLWACGEVAASGAHGANRLASNSLLEALVFAARAAHDIGERRRGPTRARGLRWLRGNWAPSVSAARSELRDLMWRHAGVSRDAEGLQTAVAEIQYFVDRRARTPDLELGNLLTIARVVAQSALIRRESRGSHFRSDFVESSPLFNRHLRWIATERAGRVERADRDTAQVAAP
ncbi:MAG: L-aspartate oxidase [Acidobacteriota bacterium]|nr:L-aspartate oxidase [Acidobacteriota bacterium]